MGKGKVIDLFSGVEIEEPMARPEGVDGGNYAGHVHPLLAATLRKNEASLREQSRQIDDMMNAWYARQEAHTESIQELAELLGVFDFDPEVDLLYVADDGHVWVKRGVLN